nr:MAG TPA: hypothetical protein [Caudoviricetes sp.]
MEEGLELKCPLLMLLLHGVEARGFLQTMELFGELDRELLNRELQLDQF